jgi:hypothetical protein
MALGSTSPSSVFGGLTVRRAVRTPAMQFGPSSVETSGIVVSAGIAPPARFPTTTTSADFWPDCSRQISPGKSVMLPCATTAFTSTGKPDDFAVLCQLVVPRRPCMRFLSIGSQVSPSLPSPGRSPFPSWPQMVVSSFSCLVFLQGTCTPFTSRPCWAHTRRVVTTTTSRSVSMIFLNHNPNLVIDARPRW